MDQYTTREEARDSLLTYARMKLQALRNVIGQARLTYDYYEREMKTTGEYISHQQQALAQAEAAERYFHLTLADEALARGHVVVFVRPHESKADDEKLLLLSGMSILSSFSDLCSHSRLQGFPNALARWAVKRR